jgi:molybdopterin-guanine dinucleotide biosynthesis protein B
MRIEQFGGWSDSGKTTRIVELIARYVAEGRRVAAIKHTHHPLNDEDRGDTAKFRAAGANPVILAGEGEAVLFDGEKTSRIAFTEPEELLARLTADVVMIEGFKNRILR